MWKARQNFGQFVMDAISEAEAETMDNIFQGYLTDAIPDSQLVVNIFKIF